MKHVYLIDGSSFIFRAFYAIPLLNNSAGVPVNAVFGFVTMLMKLLTKFDADYMVVIFDAGRITFRNEIYQKYKVNRSDLPADLIPQFALIRDAVRAFNISYVELSGFEADDLIATYAKKATIIGAKVTIVSSDKDLMQLINDQIVMFDPIRDCVIESDDVLKKFGVPPNKVGDVQSLAGDLSDNIPGVPGIGIKIAAQLINEFGNLENLLDRAGEIKQLKRRENLLANIETIRIFKKLVCLRTDVPITEDLENFTVKNPDKEVLLSFLDKHGFSSIRDRLINKSVIKIEDSYKTSNVVSKSNHDADFFDVNCELVFDCYQLDLLISEINKIGIVAFTIKIDSSNPRQCNGISLALTSDKSFYIPISQDVGVCKRSLNMDLDDSHKFLTNVEIISRLRILFKDQTILKIGYDIKFDLQVLSNYDFLITPFDDIMLLSYVLESGKHGHSMNELSDLYLGYKIETHFKVCSKHNSLLREKSFNQDMNYVSKISSFILKIHSELKSRLITEHMMSVYELIERPLVPIITTMERIGIKVDKNELQRISTEFDCRMTDLEHDICLLAGVDFNIGSPKQLGDIMFNRLGLPSGKKRTKTGAYETGIDILEKLAPLHPLPRKILNWRQLSKLKNTYADALIDQINSITGRVHTNYAMAVTSTGRLSSLDPNLQNIPVRTEEGRRIRRAFIAEVGFKLLSADYSQIELRLIAHVAGINGFKQAFHDGVDIHKITASQVFNLPIEKLNSSIRRKAKAINFGIIYGISAFGLARQLGISNIDAKHYIDAYFEQYPEILNYMNFTKKQAQTKGFVYTLFGRKCFVPNIIDRNSKIRSFSERVAINAPIQGSAADIIKRAMVRLPSIFAVKGLTANMLLQVHDELVFEVPENEIEETKTVIKSVMENVVTLDVPLLVEIGVADNWADAH
ncbi:MAG: DNA polymerase I [Rhodospirillaceae bacterium]|jgi:DNA polymerase-1|nr:DNA polymerase I [Rhodospirillaceae bacterium]